MGNDMEQLRSLMIEVTASLARIEERQVALRDRFDMHVAVFAAHADDDKKNFADLLIHKDRVTRAAKIVGGTIGLVSGVVGAWLSRHF